MIPVRPAPGVPAASVTARVGLLLLVLGVGTLVEDAVRQARAGRRWLADPPGPPRD